MALAHTFNGENEENRRTSKQWVTETSIVSYFHVIWLDHKWSYRFHIGCTEQECLSLLENILHRMIQQSSCLCIWPCCGMVLRTFHVRLFAYWFTCNRPRRTNYTWNRANADLATLDWHWLQKQVRWNKYVEEPRRIKTDTLAPLAPETAPVTRKLAIYFTPPLEYPFKS